MDNYTRMLQEQFYGYEVSKMLQKKEDLIRQMRRTRSSDIQRFSVSCKKKPEPPFPFLFKNNKTSTVRVTSIDPTFPLPAKNMSIRDSPRIIENILKYVDVNQLKTCRFVNKLWNRSACVHLKKHSFVNLVGKTISGSIGSNAEELEDFWRVFYLSKLHRFPSPFKKFGVSIELIQDILIDEKILCDSSNEIILLEYSTDENITSDPICYKNLYQILSKNAKSLEKFTYKFSYMRSQSQASQSQCQSQCQCQLGAMMGMGGDSIHQKLLIGNDSIGSLTNPIKISRLNLIALKEFNFFSWSYGSIFDELTFMKFLLSIFKGAPNLQRFSTNTDDYRILNYLLDRKLLRNLTDIYLKKCGESCLQNFSKANFPKLKSLGLILWKFDNRINSLEFSFIIRNVADTIEELSISRVLTDSIVDFPCFSQLRRILLSDVSGTLGILNKEIMPNLKSVYISKFGLNSNSSSECQSETETSMNEFVYPCFDQLEAKPHLGVEEIHFKCHLGSEIESYQEQNQHKQRQTGRLAATAADLFNLSTTVTSTLKPNKNKLSKLNMNYGRACVKLLAFLSQQFPNVTNFHLTMSTFSKSLVLAIIRFYPNVETLVLKSLVPGNSIPEDIFTGMDKRLVDIHFLSGGSEKNLDQIKTSLCFTNMKKLKKLVISGFHEYGCKLDYLTRNAIKYGVAEILNLETFHFDWHEALSAEVIERNLSHLSEIVIRFKREDTIDDNLIKKLKKLPKVHIIYTSSAECELGDGNYLTDKFDLRNYH